jgi:hypothetical protein
MPGKMANLREGMLSAADTEPRFFDQMPVGLEVTWLLSQYFQARGVKRWLLSRILANRISSRLKDIGGGAEGAVPTTSMLIAIRMRPPWLLASGILAMAVMIAGFANGGRYHVMPGPTQAVVYVVDRFTGSVTFCTPHACDPVKLAEAPQAWSAKPLAFAPAAPGDVTEREPKP